MPSYVVHLRPLLDAVAQVIEPNPEASSKDQLRRGSLASRPNIRDVLMGQFVLKGTVLSPSFVPDDREGLRRLVADVCERDEGLRGWLSVLIGNARGRDFLLFVLAGCYSESDRRTR